MSDDPMREYSEVMRQIAAENKESEEANRKYAEQEFRKKYDTEDYEPTEEEIEAVTRRVTGGQYDKPGDDPEGATEEEIEGIIKKMRI